MGTNHDIYYDKYDINKDYRTPQTYNTNDSSYPPDWNTRVEATRERFGGVCQRCCRNIADIECPPNAHHYRPLSEDGTNELSNLILLCGHCHDAMHEHGLNSGDAMSSPIFPHLNSDNRVAVVREPKVNADVDRFDRPVSDVKVLLNILEENSSVKENQFSISEGTYAIGPEDARDAQNRLEDIIENRTGKSAEAIISQRNTEYPRRPEEAFGVECPRCSDSILEDRYVGFPISPTEGRLTVTPPEEEAVYYPVCYTCAKKVYQSHNLSSDDVTCFGEGTSEPLENAEQIPSQISINVLEEPIVEELFTVAVVDEGDNRVSGVVIYGNSIPEFETDAQGTAQIPAHFRGHTTLKAKYEIPSLSGTELIGTSKGVEIQPTKEEIGAAPPDTDEGESDQSHNERSFWDQLTGLLR